MPMPKPNDWFNKYQYEIYDLPKRVIFRFEWIVVTGLLLTILPIMNILEVTNISGDYFWALAGACLMVEGIIELYYERRKQG